MSEYAPSGQPRLDLLTEVSILREFILTRIWPLETIMYETLCPVIAKAYVLAGEYTWF